MRIVQIIDSLEPGGAERMAVNYANALAKKIDFSALVTTRKEGVLKDQIDDKVSYLFLNKKKRVDVSAVFRLRKYILRNKITWVHAHSSSYFIAVLVKLTVPKIKIIWHDHYGISQDLSSRKSIVLKLTSCLFTGSIAVNSALKKWSDLYLLNSKVIYLPNFINLSKKEADNITLNGNKGTRIICVANLRPQKNHKFLIETALAINNHHPDWTFHLFGKDFEDLYSTEIKNMIEEYKLREVVFLYGSTKTISSALEQCDIAVLPSLSEGLPLALLEYGQHTLPVIATRVGEVDKIITCETEGLLIKSNDIKQFVYSLEKLITDPTYRVQMALTLHKKIMLEYSENNIMDQYTSWLYTLSNLPKNDFTE